MKRKGKRVNTSQSSECEWIVEDVIDKRITEEGRVEYLLHWKDYPEANRTWEPEEHLSCFELISKFEEKLKKSTESNSNGTEVLVEKPNSALNEKIGVGNAMSPSLTDDSMKNSNSLKKNPSRQVRGDSDKIMHTIDKSLIPDKVVGVINDNSEGVLVKMKWKNKEEKDLIPSSIANTTWPQLVINYYQQRIRWQET